MENKSEQIQRSSSNNVYCELRELASILTDIIESIKISQQPITESHDMTPGSAKQSEDTAHQLLDAADSISNRESKNTLQLKELRKILPMTYFRNNSRVKRVIDVINKNITANQDDIIIIMDVLQSQDIAAQQSAHTVSLLDQVENRLQTILQKYDNSNSEQHDNKFNNDAFKPDTKYDISCSS